MSSPRLLTLAGAALVALAAPALGQSPPPGPRDIETRPASADRRTVGGFRMEGDPFIETVFGDTARFKKYVDRFYDVHESMRTTRAAFYRQVQATIATLAAHTRGQCPEDAVAPHYARAYTSGQSYRELGADLESNYISIRALDGLGETAGLTPDYRWKVSRARGLYESALIDYREMRAAFADQLASEMKFRQCNTARLLAVGSELNERQPVPAEPPPPLLPTGKHSRPTEPPVPASMVTFFVDNTSCPSTVRVFIDSALVGEVSARAKAAFQAHAGRHTMCLIPGSSTAQCGDTGTVRSAQVHDGWSVQMRCD